MTVHHVRTGPTEYRVIRAADGPGRLVLLDRHHLLDMYADLDGLTRLAALWSLAARSARSLVHLPLRGRPAPAGYHDGLPNEIPPVALDVLLVHHSLQFRPADWKALRNRLGPGRPHTTATPDQDFPAEYGSVRRRPHDHLRFDRAARTLVVTGSPAAFRFEGTGLRRLLTDAPAAHRTWPATHQCTELDAGPWLTYPVHTPVPRRIHLQYCPDWQL
ncbi:hypothetical protein ACFV1L_31385 [Kitasatospora sp. NPDC059646]|uniref:hypothetical protein n=1 Tax=Kitasatospora sp. NPDC059646 TaxID=3346893 RepID=UPI0036754567